MTIRFLRDYQGYSSGSEMSTFSTAQENLIIAAGAATRTLGSQQLSIYPSANAAGVKPANNPVMLSSDGSSLVSGDGTQYPLTPITATFAQATAQLSAAVLGSVWRISDLGGTYWEKSSTGILRPVNNIAVTHNIAAPVVGVANVTPKIFAEYLLPAGALQNGFFFELLPLFSKSGATDSMAMNIAISATAGSVGTTISLSGAIAIVGAANRRAGGRYRMQRLSATSVGSGITNVQGEGWTSGSAYAAITSVPSMANAAYLQVVGTMSAAPVDVCTLESCPLTIIGNPNL